MTLPKRRISISLDGDLVAQLEAIGESLSAQINAAVRADLERRRRQQLLNELLDYLDAEHGPVDETRIGHYVELLR